MPGMHHFVGASRAIAAADVTLHANWGTTPTLALAGNGQRGKVTITAKATTGADPTVVVAFPLAFEAAPAAVLVGKADVNDTEEFTVTAISTTSFTVTLKGTPTADTVYSFYYFVCP